ncbi:MAG: D-alanyl-D-alanine carboxypeptidase/D-alanyl-D-alanine-endopeptidase, partial [Candidatus Cloacimonetes bacterium]|nr:D-alanyl-D-alanine carboxypeptidase/D-alanyl-D-alanine-endopeptidase [Candidatus Cloacimonadota bacterium]
LVTIYPSNKGLDLINKTVITKNKRLQYFDFQTYPTENKLIVGGRIYDKSRTQYRSLSLPIPELYSLQLFKTNLENQKIKIFGTIDYKHFTETDMVLNQIEFLFEHNSLPLSTVIYEINKNSNNFMANQVFLTIGDQIDNTLQSENIIKQWLIDNNVNVLNLKMFDGSGLSSYNLCTANILTSVLKIMHESNDYQNYFKSLPISGVDGTLECQFGYNGLRKKIFAKTGTINGVRSLSGYTYTKDKELVAFSIILNKDNSKLHLSNTIMEKILKQILNFKRDTNLYANNKSLKS